MRQTDKPNVRVQDGLKLPWLCQNCEGRFNRYETAFATKLFYPWHAGVRRIAYGDWLLKFSVSVSWRVLRYARGRNKDAPYTREQHMLMDQAEMRWRAFLNDEAPHPAAFEQHLYIFDMIESTTIPNLPNNINRFMAGAVTLDIVGSSQSMMTFAKLGSFMIFGMIQKGKTRWHGTKIHVKHGLVKPDRVELPFGLLNLIREKAVHSATAMDTMSTMQRDKVDRSVFDNLEGFAKSDQFASIVADAEMFGVDAVLRKE